jgi:hypothetical protein
MGIFSDFSTKKKLGDGVMYVDAAWNAQDIGALVVAFQNARRLASEVEMQLAPKVSLRPPRVVTGMPSEQGVFVDLYR